ncbi:hypothetical protein NA56DRAFT_685006 [Hyaloscypha hepaticicola]|uniref:Uncharacterized protein n=1 Tax=Hyaloscypha hepaticicola TaxID=2082293 RepID=A0A2J6QK80_9HELO|nr:hypothetical protein NA56DRAFT_685006 [Hyaloscypha hepaticicola]
MTREEIAPTDSPGGMTTDATGLGTFAEDSNDMSQLYPDEQLQLHPLDGNWNEVTEEELTAAFNDFNKETSQDGLAYPEHGTMDKRNIPFNETLSSSLDSFSNEQPDAETLENGTKSHDNETESIDLASLFGENEDEVQDGQNGLNEKENSFTGPLLPSNKSKLPQVLTRPPKCRLTLPRPSLLTLPQTPQEFLQQHAHPGTQQAKQQLQQRVGPRVSFGTLNLIHPTPTPKRGPKAANAKQVQAPRLRTSRQSQRAGTSSVPSMTSSSNTFGALNVASQYAPSEIPQPANRHQHFTTDSRQPMQSFASPKAQTTIFNGSFDNMDLNIWAMGAHHTILRGKSHAPERALYRI